MDTEPARTLEPRTPQPAFLTTSEVAEYTRLSTNTITRAIRKRDLTAVRLGPAGRYRIRPEWVDQWLRDTGAEEPPR